MTAADVAMSEAGSALERGDAADAAAICGQYLSDRVPSKDDVEVWMLRGRAHYQLGRMEEAIRDFSAVIQVEPDYPDAHFEKGKAQLRLGKCAEAEASFTRDLEQAGQQAPIAHFNRHSARRGQSDYAGAMQDLDAAVAGLPDVLPIRIARARLAFQLGRFEVSVVDFKKAISLAIDLADAEKAEWFAGAGLSFGELGRNEEAVIEMNNAIAHKADEPVFYCNRGWLYHNLANLEEAERDLTRAVEINPGYARAYKNRAIVRERGGDTSGAKEDYHRLAALGHDVVADLARLSR